MPLFSRSTRPRRPSVSSVLRDARIARAVLETLEDRRLFANAAVTGVFVNGTAWAQPFRDFVASSGEGDATFGYGLDAADHADELPWTNLNQVSFRFNEAVNVTVDDLAIRGVNVAQYTGLTLAYDPTTLTATWTLPTGTFFDRDKLILDLNANDGGVSHANGDRMDGEWINPVAPANGGADSFPSGDGATDGDFRFRVNVLPGDVDRDGDILADDVELVRAAQGNPPGAGLYTIFKDVNGSGSILGTDVTLTRNRQATTLPAGEPKTPQLTASAGGVGAYEGHLYSISMSTSDPAKTTGWSIDWGDGTTSTAGPGNTKATHVYADGHVPMENVQVVATATVSGLLVVAPTVNVGIFNEPPNVWMNGDKAVEVDATYTLDLSATDLGDDEIAHWTINWGDGTPAETITGNPPSATHTYTRTGSFTVMASVTDEDGTFPASFVVQVGPTTPAPPTGFAADAVHPTEVNLTWDDAVAEDPGESGYRIEKSSDGGMTYTTVAVVAANATGYTVTGLSSETTYTFAIRTIRDGKESPNPAKVTKTMPALWSTEKSNDGSSETLVEFDGGDQPAGFYRVEYVSGALDYTGDTYRADWTVNHTGGEYFFSVVYRGQHPTTGNPETKSITAPGTSSKYGKLGKYLEAEAAYYASLGSVTPTFYHVGGVIGIKLKDWEPGNNRGSIKWRLVRLPDLPTVSITATQPTASEQGRDAERKGVFTITRTGSTDAALTVKLHNIAGTAKPGTDLDYPPLPETVTIDAGKTSATIEILPYSDGLTETPETVAIYLESDAAYFVGTPGATVTIHDGEPIDLDVDSDNDNGFDAAERDQNEDEAEDAQDQPGKVIAVNDDDTDGDGVPDFADGYGYGYPALPQLAETEGERFTPVTFTVPANRPVNGMSITIEYEGSDPNSVRRSGSGTAESPYVYTLPDDGNRLRLWTQDGSVRRDKRSVAVYGGHFVAPGVPLSAAELGLSESKRTITLWAEALRPSAVLGDIKIKASASWPGSPALGSLNDAVRLTAAAQVSVTAVQPDAYESGPSGPVYGAFRVSRKGLESEDLLVHLETMGTATPDVDFAALPTSVWIPAGQAHVDISVHVRADGVVEDEFEDVTLRVKETGPANTVLLYNPISPPINTNDDPMSIDSVVIADHPPLADPDELQSIIYPDRYQLRGEDGVLRYYAFVNGEAHLLVSTTFVLPETWDDAVADRIADGWLIAQADSDAIRQRLQQGEAVTVLVPHPEPDANIGTLIEDWVEQMQLEANSVGEPTLWESVIPFWGSSRQAVHDFQVGDWGWGLAHTALAVTDIFLIKSLVTGGSKLLFKAAIDPVEAAARRATTEAVAQRLSAMTSGDLRILREAEAAVSLPNDAARALHKAAGWTRYQARGNTRLNEAQWNKMFDLNLQRAKSAAKKVDDYHATLGWGTREVTVGAGPSQIARRLDIADEVAKKGIEYKTGYQTANVNNLWELVRDAMLKKDDWQITWVFEGKASQPLLKALDAVGIPYVIR